MSQRERDHHGDQPAPPRQPLTLLVFDGAGTAGRTSKVVDAVAERIRWKTGCHVVWVPWAASLIGVGGKTPWPVATAEAIRWAVDYMWRHEGQYVLVGYSAGCRPARELLQRHPGLKDQVAAIAHLADPWQPANRQQDGVPNGPGHGIMGQEWGPVPNRTFWCGAPWDPICRAAPDSLLRYLTASTDAVPGGLFHAFVDKAHRGRLQLIPFLGLPLHLWFGGLGGRIQRSIGEAQSYLGDGHDVAYKRYFPTPGDTRSLAHRLADSVAWRVRDL
ncbi:hypothetical protein [Dietzia sp. PP-33]|jgi:hypothetical protein|uniref:hypothetical protein n=1 Tax=Dietzia sp. PP-33 TaxID=2957500 RepID=UPI0029A91C9A|nr:hypothetical protein [Dietzia sp. PP-33]MDX2357451.1 hypothetical protein [Dietzia sp. PP-33]